jgi:predicted outer membrane protein
MNEQKTTRKTPSSPRLKQPKAFALAVIILLAFGTLYAFQSKMKSADRPQEPAATPEVNATDSERTYLIQMIPHHQETVDASRYIAENAESDELKAFAQKLSDKESKEVWMLIGFYQLWFKSPYPGAAEYVKTMPDLTQLSGRALEKVYLQGMMEHHRQALKTNQALLQVTAINELKTLANEMTFRHVDELSQMQKWLNTY